MTGRLQVELDAPGLPRPGTVIRYGHWGRPVVVFPSERGRAWDYEDHGMVEALGPLLDGGRVKLYCVDSFDEVTWSDGWISGEERARRHGAYASWITDQVVPFVGEDTPGAADAVVTGCSLGAYHALQVGLTRADLVGVVIGLSGNYDPSTWRAWGERGEAAYFTNPSDYVPGLGGEHLDWLRSRLKVVLVAGQGAWETHPTQSLPQTRRMAGLLQERGIDCDLDLWGHDSAHEWEWWRRQIVHHLPRFC